MKCVRQAKRLWRKKNDFIQILTTMQHQFIGNWESQSHYIRQSFLVREQQDWQHMSLNSMKIIDCSGRELITLAHGMFDKQKKECKGKDAYHVTNGYL